MSAVIDAQAEYDKQEHRRAMRRRDELLSEGINVPAHDFCNCSKCQSKRMRQAGGR